MFNKIIKIFALLIFLQLNYEGGYCKKYHCQFEETWECTIRKLELTHDDFVIEPVAPDFNNLTQLVLYGTIPKLSAKKICEVMPNLENIYAESVSIETIEENTFEGCSNLKILHLTHNKFVNLNKNSFKGLTNLKEFWISGGNLTTFDADLTDLKNLTELRIRNFDIVNLPAEILREQTNLEELVLDSNPLFDIEIEKILEFAPNLKKLEFNDLNVKCSRINEIWALVKKNGINTWRWIDKKRVRSYTPDNVLGVMCLNNEQWESELAKLPHDQQLLFKKA